MRATSSRQPHPLATQSLTRALHGLLPGEAVLDRMHGRPQGALRPGSRQKLSGSIVLAGPAISE